jgi:hypothetical protein
MATLRCGEMGRFPQSRLLLNAGRIRTSVDDESAVTSWIRLRLCSTMLD